MRSLARRVPRALLAHKELLAHKAQREMTEPMEPTEQQVLRVLLAHKAQREMMELQALLAHKALLALKAQRVMIILSLSTPSRLTDLQPLSL